MMIRVITVGSLSLFNGLNELSTGIGYKHSLNSFRPINQGK